MVGGWVCVWAAGGGGGGGDRSDGKGLAILLNFDLAV